MLISSCPNQQILKQLLSGRLDDEQAAPLEEHLLHCKNCVEVVSGFVDDDDLAAASRMHKLLSNDDDDILEQVIEQAKKLRSDADTVKVADTLAAGVPAGSIEPSVAAILENDEPDIHFLAPAQHPDELGRLGDYRVLQVLGVGGMGIVFRAEDPRLKRQVALKVMKPSIASSGFAKERFIREAQFNASIEHDNVVQIYQVGEDRSVPFIAMQYLRGESLKTRLERDGKLRQSDVVRIGKEVAAGLAAAHKQGLIHRDIKPDNIWLEAETKRAKILDFGLVRAGAEDTGLTMTGMVVGTPQYMAPEQALGQLVDHRCDLFSLGSVLYQLATGKRAFKGANLTATLMAVVQQDPVPIERIAPQLHLGLSALITKLLSKDRSDRPQTAAEVSRALAEIEQEFQQPATVEHVAVAPPAIVTTARGAKASPPFKKPPRKRTFLAAAGGAAALLLCGFIVITITNKDGKKTTIKLPEGAETNIQVAAGSKVDIVQQDDIPNPFPSTSNTDGWHGWPADAPKPAIAPFDAEQAKQHQDAWAKYLRIDVASKHSIGTKFVLIPPGEFLMGASEDQSTAALERPQHRVSITRPFLLGATEVTVREFGKFVAATNYVTEAEKYGSTESADTTPPEVPPETLVTWRSTDELDLPVVNISWNDATAYCEWLSLSENVTYRLPTEAEWEYSCRAGTDTLFHFGDDPVKANEYAWYKDNSDMRLHRVGSKLPNAFGLHDMHGNVKELCQDRFDLGGYQSGESLDPTGATTGDLRAAKGSCFPNSANSTRSSGRQSILQTFRCNRYGFRVVRTLDFPLRAGSMAQYRPYTEPEPPDYAAERQAAEWVLSVGGNVTLVNAKGEIQNLTQASIPAGEWELQVVNLSGCQKVRDDDLQRFANCRRLSELNLHFTSVSGTGLVQLKGFNNLQKLSLMSTSLTDESVLDLAQLQHLTELNLTNCQGMTDRSLITVGQLTGLTQLYIGACGGLTDAGMSHLQGLTQLRAVSIAHSPITDAGLTTLLAQHPQLESIYVGSHPDHPLDHTLAPLADGRSLKFVQTSSELLTDQGLSVLRAMPSLESVQIAPNATAKAAEQIVGATNVRHLALYFVYASDAGPGDAGYAALAKHPTLTELKLFGAGQSPTDTALASLTQLPQLQTLTLNFSEQYNKRNYTPAGIEAFRKSRPDVQLWVDGTDYPPTTGPNAPPDYAAEREAAEWVLSVGGILSLVNAEGAIHWASDGRLPDGNWALLQANLTSCQDVRDDDLERFAGCSRLRDLILIHTPLTGRGLNHLVPIRSLTLLDLTSVGGHPSDQMGTSLQDDMLAPLAQMPQLTNLSLGFNAALTDDALRQLSGLTNLERLQLLGLQNITDRGLAHLTALHKLKSVQFDSQKTTDVGVADLISHNPDLAELVVGNADRIGNLTLLPLSNAKNLNTVGISGDQLTAEGLPVLQQLPLLESATMSVPISDEAVARLNELPNLNYVRLYFWKAGQTPPHAGYDSLVKHRGISILELTGNGGGSPSDAELLALASMPKLSHLIVSFNEQYEKRNYTAAGIEDFRKARPDVKLNVDGKDYPALASWPEAEDGSLATWTLPAGVPAPAIVPFPTDDASNLQQAWADFIKQPVEITNSLGMTFRLIPPTELTMEDAGQFHRVRVPQPNYLGTTEVTFSQFEEFVATTGYETEAEKFGIGKNIIGVTSENPTWKTPGFTPTVQHPITHLTIKDVWAFCDWLSKAEGVSYRLPTPAEFQAAACSGGDGQWAWCATAEEMATFGVFSDTRPADAVGPSAVQTCNATPYGLFDTLGNVAEYVEPSIAGLDYPGQSFACAEWGKSYRKPVIEHVLTPGKTGNFPQANVGFRVLREVPNKLSSSPKRTDQRSAATTILNAGGQLTIWTDGVSKDLNPGDPLPDGRFVISGITLHRIDQKLDRSLIDAIDPLRHSIRWHCGR